jgi:LDH2 family malate/lactate/ureidoglycolate dehydrogenase
MRFLADRGEKMPLDWALTPEGEETDDPAAAMAGALLGIGQYKGYGLSFMSDVLTGVIAGGAFGLTPYADPAKLDVSHTFLAFDPAWFGPIDDFKARMNAFIAEVKSAKLRPGFQEVLVPGELEHRRETEKRASGVPLPRSEANDLRALAGRLGVDASALGGAA